MSSSPSSRARAVKSVYEVDHLTLSGSSNSLVEFPDAAAICL
jgi:hypothetical protein